MKVLVTGARGQVGRAVIAAAPATTQIVAVAHGELDIGDAPVAVDRFVESPRPDVIINAAAYTAVDRAESEPEMARRVNATGPGEPGARGRGAVGARLIHLSTDFVFDGVEFERPTGRTIRTNPLSVYGATKLAGEQCGCASCSPSARSVLRTAWVYDAARPQFRAHHAAAHARARHGPRGRRPVRARRRRRIRSRRRSGRSSRGLQLTGIHHWTDAGVASWYDFAVAIAEEWRGAGTGSAAAGVIPIAHRGLPDPGAAARVQRARQAGHAAPRWI